MRKFRNQILRFNSEPAAGGGEPTEPEKGESGDLEKALADVEKWKSLSRRNESRAKENADKAERFDALEEQSKTDLQKAVDEAVSRVRTEMGAQLGMERANHAFEKALTGRIPDTGALLSLDRSQFVDGDMADLEKITAWVEANSTEVTAKKKDVDLGQGRERGTNSPAKGVAAGADLFNSRNKKKS